MKQRRALLALAAAAVVASVAAVLALTKPPAAPPRPARVMEVVHEPGEAAPVRDEEGHFAPGSPAAVAERYLRLRLRHRYDDALALATGAERALCRERLERYQRMSPEEREAVRQAQVMAAAAAMDLERVVVDDLPADDAGVAAKRVRGVLWAHGTVEGRRVENRREQTLVLRLLDGAWRVAEWTSGRSERGIQVQP